MVNVENVFMIIKGLLKKYIRFQNRLRKIKRNLYKTIIIIMKIGKT